MAVTVYSKPSCRQCDSTTKHLDKLGIEYVKLDVTEDAAALETIKNLGYLQAPVVKTEDGHHFSGYRPDELDKLAS